MQNSVGNHFAQGKHRKFINVPAIKPTYHRTHINVPKHKLIRHFQLFLYRTAEFLPIYELIPNQSLKHSTLNFDKTILWIRQKRIGMGKPVIMTVLAKNAKILQLFQCDHLHCITFLLRFTAIEGSLIHLIAEGSSRLFVKLGTNLREHIIGNLGTLHLQFLQFAFACRTTGSVHTDIA